MNRRILKGNTFAIFAIFICSLLLVGLAGEYHPVSARETQAQLFQIPPEAMPDRYGFRTGFFRYIYDAIGVVANDNVTGLTDCQAVIVSLPQDGTLYSDLAMTTMISIDDILPGQGPFVYFNDTLGDLEDSFEYKLTCGGGLESPPAIVTLTNSITCTIDTQGADDEPGQKDLTQFCRDTYYEMTETELAISWNWDDLVMSGNNSDDACALFDTDGDGFANYSICMSWNLELIPGADYPKFYACTADSKSQTCMGRALISNQDVPYSCQLLYTDDDPFNNGVEWPQDSKAICYIPYENTFGTGADVNFLDVCSYPSQIPNSDPSDCVKYSKNPTFGTLKVIKDVVNGPTDSIIEWVIDISPLTIEPLDNDGPADNNLFGDDETPNYTLIPGTYTVTENQGSLTNPYLSLASSEYWCENIGVSPVAYYPNQSQSGTTINNLPVAAGDFWECTFTNSYNPTAVDLLYFEPQAVPVGVLLTWETANEIDNLGFNLYRSSTLEPERVKLNSELIPTKTYPGAPFGAVYTYFDEDVVPGVTYRYWLEDVGLDGNQVKNVIEASIVPKNWIFVPMIRR